MKKKKVTFQFYDYETHGTHLIQTYLNVEVDHRAERDVFLAAAHEIEDAKRTLIEHYDFLNDVATMYIFIAHGDSVYLVEEHERRGEIYRIELLPKRVQP